jgi:formate C-acetyltransferase
VDRLRLVTGGYEESESKPIATVRATALYKILTEMKIYILPCELIVGNLASTPRAAPLYPEFCGDWIVKELDDFANRPGDRFVVADADKEEIKKLFPYWKGKTFQDYATELAKNVLPEDALRTWDPIKEVVNDTIWSGRTRGGQGGDAHIVPNFEKLVKVGFKGINDEINQCLKRMDITDPDYVKKTNFLRAGLTVIDATTKFARRFAFEARKQMEKESDRQRRNELEKIARVCEWVPENPARTFHEAIQSIWFVFLALFLESNGHALAFGRMDQYLYPFYKSDLEEGRLSREEALELVECFFLKVSELEKVQDWNSTRYLAGHQVWVDITLGGQTRDGTDAVNDLSRLFLEGVGELKLEKPTVIVRVHDRTSEEFLSLACKTLLKHGGGMPAFFNDEVVVPMLINNGLPLEDARDWALMGCAEPTVMGKGGTASSAFTLINLLKVLELAVNDGLNPNNGITLCRGNGDLTTFTSFKEVMEAYKNQLDYYVKVAVLLGNVSSLTFRDYCPTPLLSVLIDGLIEKGLDIEEGGAFYLYENALGGGNANVGNALAAMKKLVFEDKLISASELKHALDTNFANEKGEKIRQMLINVAPKYGNDDDYVDFLTKEALEYWMRTMRKYKSIRGGFHSPTPQTVSTNVPQGDVVGATPDGRKAGESLADNISPTQGTDHNGPTAVIKSATTLDHMLMTSGTILNMKFHPSALEDEDKIRKFTALIRTYFDLKGMQVQFNVISNEILRDAQKHPEKYKDLMVKVAGYTALFVELDRKTQDDIISRNEMACIS